MNCRLFQQFMYLKKDELSEGERKEFFRHRSSCPLCAAEFAQVEQSRSVIQRLAAAVPELADPHSVTVNILESVADRMKLNQRPRYHSLLDAVVDRLTLPSIRAGMAALLFVVGISFILEYTSAFFRLKEFEERIAAANVRKPAMAEMGIGRERLVQGVLDFSRLISGEQPYAAPERDWVMIRRSSLRSLMLLYSELSANASQLPPEFHNAYPELSKLLSRNISSSRVEELPGERDALLYELNSLIAAERKTP